jgi:hypothetical protein
MRVSPFDEEREAAAVRAAIEAVRRPRRNGTIREIRQTIVASPDCCWHCGGTTIIRSRTRNDTREMCWCLDCGGSRWQERDR